MQCLRCEKEIDNDSLYCKYCGRKQVRERRKPIKMPNGYGCVIKLGGRRRKPYAIRITTGFIEGQQQYRYISYHETYSEAVKALAAEQVCPTPAKVAMTFEELYEEWKSTTSFTSLSKQTQDNYRAAYKHLDKLYSLKFSDIRTGHMQRIIDEMKLSHSSKSKVKLLCHLLFKYAMQNDIVNKNYAEFVKLGKHEKAEKEIFTDLEIQKLFKHDTIPYVDTILILIYTGMRINEMLSLTKHAIDWKEKTITGGLKTDAGKNRVIPIHPKIEKYLRNWYDKSTGLLFCRENDTPITDNYYRAHIYYPILEQLEVPRKTPHCTRHTCATLLAKNGADTNSIKQILGHTDYAFTADVYTHVDITALKNAINCI